MKEEKECLVQKTWLGFWEMGCLPNADPSWNTLRSRDEEQDPRVDTENTGLSWRQAWSPPGLSTRSYTQAKGCCSYPCLVEENPSKDHCIEHHEMPRYSHMDSTDASICWTLTYMLQFPSKTGLRESVVHLFKDMLSIFLLTLRTQWLLHLPNTV